PTPFHETRTARMISAVPDGRPPALRRSRRISDAVGLKFDHNWLPVHRFRGGYVVHPTDRERMRAADASASEVRGAGEKHGMPARPGATLAEERLLGVVGAKLRAKMLPGGCAPEFDVAVTRPEGLAAEHAGAGAAVREIPAAGQHRNIFTICAVLRARS